MHRRRFLQTLAGLGAVSLLPGSIARAASPLPKGMVTFTFDDGIVTTFSRALPILNRRGQVATAGLVASRLLSGNNDYMDVEQARGLEKAGWEIASHSLTHTRPIHIPKTYAQERIEGWHVDLSNPDHFQAQYGYDLIAGLYEGDMPLREADNAQHVTQLKGSYWFDRCIGELHVHPYKTVPADKLDIRSGSYQRELEQSKRMLADMGFGVDTYIAPYNYWTDDVEELSTRYYARACTGRDSDNRPATFDRFAIKRFMVHERDSAQSLIRIIQDHSLAYGGWVMFCFHGVGDPIGWEPYAAEKLDAVAAWIAQERIPLVTVRQGTKIMLDLELSPKSRERNVVKRES